MADNSKTAAVMSTAAAIAAALALLNSQKASAAVVDSNFPPEITELLIAMAANLDKLANGGSGNAGVVQGWPPNCNSIVSSRLIIGAANTPYQLPEFLIPDGFELQLKAWPTNGGIIYVAPNPGSAVNINSIWPLIANEGINYKIDNSKEIFISGSNAGDSLVFTVEQRK